MVLDDVAVGVEEAQLASTEIQRRLLAASEVPSEIAQDIDMRDINWWHAIIDAFDKASRREK